jgi:hypothetical protein
VKTVLTVRCSKCGDWCLRSAVGDTGTSTRFARSSIKFSDAVVIGCGRPKCGLVSIPMREIEEAIERALIQRKPLNLRTRTGQEPLLPALHDKVRTKR